MHIAVLSLVIATAVCGFLLLAFWVFTKTPLGREIEAEERRRSSRHERSSARPQGA